MKLFLLLLNGFQLLTYYFFPKNDKLMLSYKSGYWSFTSFSCYFVHFNVEHLLVNLCLLNLFLLLPPQLSPWTLWFFLSWTISCLQYYFKQLDPEYADRWQSGGASCVVCAYMTLHLFLTNATSLWLYAIKLASLYLHWYHLCAAQHSSRSQTDFIGHRIGHFTGFMFSVCFYLTGNNITQTNLK